MIGRLLLEQNSAEYALSIETLSLEPSSQHSNLISKISATTLKISFSGLQNGFIGLTVRFEEADAIHLVKSWSDIGDSALRDNFRDAFRDAYFANSGLKAFGSKFAVLLTDVPGTFIGLDDEPIAFLVEEDVQISCAAYEYEPLLGSTDIANIDIYRVHAIRNSSK